MAGKWSAAAGRIFATIFFLCLWSAPSNCLPVTWCIPSDPTRTTENVNEALCEKMSNEIKDTYKVELEITCVLDVSVYACIRQIQNKTADIVRVSPEDAYVAARYHELEPLVTEEYSNGPKAFSVAIIKKGGGITSIQNLEGKKSCHANIDLPASWAVPYGRLIQKGVMKTQFGCDASLNNTYNFFSQSCAPGDWATDAQLHSEKGDKLCALCSSTCHANDPYGTYMGAVQCLQHNSGDVAFTTDVMAKKIIKPTEMSQYELLCTQQTGPIGSQSQVYPYGSNFAKACHWAEIPGDFIMTSKTKSLNDKKLMRFALLSVYEGVTGALVQPEWFTKLFLSEQDVDNNIKSLKMIDSTLSGNYKNWLEEGFRISMHLDEIGTGTCGQTGNTENVPWCVISAPEKWKCEEFRDALFASRLRPTITCMEMLDYDSCIKAIQTQSAHVVNINSGNVYYAGTIDPALLSNMVPFAREVYIDQPERGYYVVPVVKTTEQVSQRLNIFRLRGKRSCHAFRGDGASWVVAAQRMMDMSQVKVTACNVARAFSQYFTGGSCVPGATDEAARLCQQCSSGEHRCKMTQQEDYFGHAGALRCLTEDKGDVAFLKHTTIKHLTDSSINVLDKAEWAQQLSSDNFRILCLDQYGTAKATSSWTTCNMGFVPSNQLIVNQKYDSRRRLALWRLLEHAQKKFGSKQYLQQQASGVNYDDAKFHMFQSRWHSRTNAVKVGQRYFHDLIFSDSTMRLEILPWNYTWKDTLNHNFFDRMAKQSDTRVRNCWYRNAAAGINTRITATTAAFAAVLAVLVLAFSRLS